MFSSRPVNVHVYGMTHFKNQDNVHMEKYDARPDSAKRLKSARIFRGFKNAKKAALYFGRIYETYRQRGKNAGILLLPARSRLPFPVKIRAQNHADRAQPRQHPYFHRHPLKPAQDSAFHSTWPQNPGPGVSGNIYTGHFQNTMCSRPPGMHNPPRNNLQF